MLSIKVAAIGKNINNKTIADTIIANIFITLRIETIVLILPLHSN
jgi:hypothetical protein